jgi:hypothetical protein
VLGNLNILYWTPRTPALGGDIICIILDNRQVFLFLWRSSLSLFHSVVYHTPSLTSSHTCRTFRRKWVPWKIISLKELGMDLENWRVPHWVFRMVKLEPTGLPIWMQSNVLVNGFMTGGIWTSQTVQDYHEIRNDFMVSFSPRQWCFPLRCLWIRHSFSLTVTSVANTH